MHLPNSNAIFSSIVVVDMSSLIWFMIEAHYLAYSLVVAPNRFSCRCLRWFNWQYNFQPEAGSPEAELTNYYLKPRDWLAESV